MIKPFNFSFHEHGKYDLPASIDKVLNTTGLSQVLYIGYSMGATTFFTMLSQRPEYNDKLIAFLALAPAVHLNHIKGVATMLLKTLDLVVSIRTIFTHILCSVRPADAMVMVINTLLPVIIIF